MLTTNFEINPSSMLDTLSFSQNMQQAGMSKDTADKLAINLKNLQINQIENLLTKKEFNIFEKEMINFQANIKDSKNELKTNIKELKVDIGDFKKEVKVDIHELRTEIIDFKEEVKVDIHELRTEMGDFKKEVKADIENFKEEVRCDIQELRTEMSDFKKEVKADIQQLGTGMGDFKKEVKADMDNLLSKKEFYNEIQKVSLNLTIKLGAIMVTGIGVIGFLLKF
jgi:hypothetical protein